MFYKISIITNTMFVLVEYNNSYKESIKECKKLNLTPVTIFNIILKDKIETKNQLDKIKEIKNKVQPFYSAIKITIEKLDNSTQGFINGLKNDFNILIGQGGLNKINRFFLEDTQIDFLLDPQNSYFKSKIDFIHHFNSGLNQVLCKAAKEKETGLFFSLNFTYGKKYNIAKEMGRINQNIKFARKYELPILINYLIQNPNQIKSKQEISAIMSLFEISTQQVKESLEIIENKINQNKLKKSQEYITEGISII